MNGDWLGRFLSSKSWPRSLINPSTASVGDQYRFLIPDLFIVCGIVSDAVDPQEPETLIRTYFLFCQVKWGNETAKPKMLRVAIIYCFDTFFGKAACGVGLQMAGNASAEFAG
jgi:hypothetical protein